MIKVKLFAQFRELLGAELVIEDKVTDTSQLQEALRKAHPALADSDMLVALNQEICTQETQLTDADEIAIFPPVTGG